MKSIYATAKILRESFSFLEKVGFKLTQEESLNYGSYVEFTGNGLKIQLNFDFRDYYFYFLLFKSEDLKYSDEAVGNDIIPFYSLTSYYNRNDLQPNKENGYELALKKNVDLLKNYFNLGNDGLMLQNRRC